MKVRESNLERLVRNLLELHGWTVLKTDAGAAKRATRGRSKRGGDIPLGWPDLTALHPQRPPVLIEVKRPGGRLRPSQRITLSALRTMGYRTYLIDSVEAIAQMLKEVEPAALGGLDP